MKSDAKTPEAYINALPEDRKKVISKLRNIILKNLPEGFSETIGYGMLAYVVPHSIYPDGYHCTPELPLPFMNIASQKNFIALYHMGLYSKKELLEWFVEAYPRHSKRKLDMGKSCIRFKNFDEIPFDLIAELATKMTVKEWINIYENTFKNRKK
jgi:hypothetical protein